MLGMPWAISRAHFILIFDNGHFSEFGTFSINDWIGHTPKALLAKNFGVPESAFEGFPKEEVYFARGPIPPEKITPNLQGRIRPPPETHKFRMLSQRTPTQSTREGPRWRVGADRPSRSRQTVTGVIPRPGAQMALRELHWHPTADEWQYASCEGKISVFDVRLARALSD